MNIPVDKPVNIEDGRHEGVILAVSYRDTPFPYTDVEVAFEGITLKPGYPTKVMECSKLGMLMKRFGFMVSEGLMVDPDKLVGKNCEFITMKKDGKKGGVFANIIPDSLKPLGVREEPAGTKQVATGQALSQEELRIIRKQDTRKVGVNTAQR